MRKKSAPRNHSQVAGRWHVHHATVMEPNGADCSKGRCMQQERVVMGVEWRVMSIARLGFEGDRPAPLARVLSRLARP